MRKAAAIMGQVWGLGKRRFGKDWERRLWLYDRLIWTVLRSKNLGMEGKGGSGEDGREVLEMVIGDEEENPGVNGKGVAKGEIKGEDRHEDIGF